MRKLIKNIVKQIRNKFDFYFGHNKFRISKDNDVVFGKNARFRCCKMIVLGKGNKITFGNDCDMNGLCILVEGEKNTIEFGDNVSVNASSVQPTVINAIGGTNIAVGSGSLFSNNIEIHSSDYHGIYNIMGERVNPDKDIVIGRDVWLGLGCKVLKGSIIANGSVVGAGSVVAGVFNEGNVVLAGNPAKVIKRQIFWDIGRNEKSPVPEALKS